MVISAVCRVNRKAVRRRVIGNACGQVCRNINYAQCCAIIHITGVGQRINRYLSASFCRCRSNCAHHRRIIRADYRERHRLTCCRLTVAHTITHRHRGLLTCCQVVVCISCWINREAVCHSVVAHTRWQVGWHIHHAQHVVCVHIAGIGQRIYRQRLASFCRCRSHRAHHRRIVRTVHCKSHGLCCRSDAVADTVAHCHGGALTCCKVVVSISFWIN